MTIADLAPWIIYGGGGVAIRLFIALYTAAHRTPEEKAFLKAKRAKEWAEAKAALLVLVLVVAVVAVPFAVYDLFGKIGAAVIVGAVIIALAIAGRDQL